MTVGSYSLFSNLHQCFSVDCISPNFSDFQKLSKFLKQNASRFILANFHENFENLFKSLIL
jgi:hypothetical protein